MKAGTPANRKKKRLPGGTMDVESIAFSGCNTFGVPTPSNNDFVTYTRKFVACWIMNRMEKFGVKYADLGLAELGLKCPVSK